MTQLNLLQKRLPAAVLIRLLSIVLVCVAALPAWAGRIVLTGANKGDIGRGDCYFVIAEALDFGQGDVRVGANSTLHFKGGSIRAGSLTFDNNAVQAPNARIFDVGSWQGTLTNAELPVCWFGNVTDGSRTAALTSDVLRRSGNSTAVIGAGIYTLKPSGNSIEVATRGNRLRVVGTLRTEDRVPAVRLRASDAALDISTIGSEIQTGADALMAVDGTVEGSTVKLGRIYMKTRNDGCAALSFDASADPGYRCRFNEFDFRYLTGGTALDFNLPATAGAPALECNRFNGGRLAGGYGIHSHRNGAASSTLAESAPAARYNLFECIGFEGLAKTCITLDGWSDSRVHNIRMAENYPRDSVAYFADCSRLRLDFKSGLNYPGIRGNGRNRLCTLDSWIMRGIYTTYNLNFNRILLDDDPADPVSPQRQYYTNDLAACALVQPLTYSADAAVPVSRLYTVDLPDGAKALGALCRLDLLDGTTLRVNYSYAETIPPLTLRVTIPSGGALVMPSNGGQWLTVSPSGTYSLQQALSSKPDTGEFFIKSVLRL